MAWLKGSEYDTTAEDASAERMPQIVDRRFKVNDGCEKSTYESKVATHLSVSELFDWKLLNKTLNAAASLAEKEEVFRVCLVIFDEKMGEFTQTEQELWEPSLDQDLVVLSALAKKHGCMHIVEGYFQTQLGEMQPGSGLRMQPLDDTTAEDANAERMPQIVDRRFKVDDGCEQSTHESKVAAHLSVLELFDWKQLNKTLNAAASQAEKEEWFRVCLVIFDETEQELWESSLDQDLVVLSALAKKHGCMHIVEGYFQTLLGEMQPGSGLRMQPLDKIMCANSTPTIGNGVAVCEKRGTMVCSECHLVKYCSQRCQKEHWPAHKVDCKSRYATMAWLEGSEYDTTAEDANAERMPQIKIQFKGDTFSVKCREPPNAMQCMLG